MKTSPFTLSKAAFSAALCGTLLFACDDPEEEAVTPAAPRASEVSAEIKSQFTELGFDVSDIARDGKNYLLEGDITITPEAFNHMLSSDPVIVNNAKGEQYRTFNLVSRNLSTIRVRSTNSNSRVLLAVDRAIFNYNQLGLTFNMVRVPASEPAEITVSIVSLGGALGVAGFPNGNGLPFSSVRLDPAAFNGRTDDEAELVVTHEIGHCLGLRHSDWYNRSLSCGQGGNEGSGSVGAEFIPGTVEFDPESIMNSCGTNRTAGFVNGEFSQFDAVALRELY